MNTLDPFKVTAPGGFSAMFTMDPRFHEVPTDFVLAASNVPYKAAVRLTGGCSNMSAMDKADMIDFFVAGFRGYRGLLMTGATRQVAVDDARGGECLDPMVTDVPEAIRDQNPDVVVLGTVPRTGRSGLVERSRLVLDHKNNVSPNPGMSAFLVVQDGPQKAMEWDGDLGVYFPMMESLAGAGGFKAVGVIAWNGGGVTKKEIMESAKRGWPTILISGSGRAADQFVRVLQGRFEGDSDNELLAQVRQELSSFSNILIVPKNHPIGLNRILRDFGFLG